MKDEALGLSQYGAFSPQVFIPAFEGADPKIVKFMLGNSNANRSAITSFRGQMERLFRRQMIVNHSIDEAHLLFDDEDPEPDTFEVVRELSAPKKRGEEMLDITSIGYRYVSQIEQQTVNGLFYLKSVRAHSAPLLPGMAHCEAMYQKLSRDPALVPDILKVGFVLFLGTVFRRHSDKSLHVSALSAFGGSQISRHLFALDREFDRGYLIAYFKEREGES